MGGATGNQRSAPAWLIKHGLAWLGDWDRFFLKIIWNCQISNKRGVNFDVNVMSGSVGWENKQVRFSKVKLEAVVLSMRTWFEILSEGSSEGNGRYSVSSA